MRKEENNNSFVSLSLLLVAIMSITAIWFFNYEFPSGSEATLLSFIKIFFRELIILSVIVVILIAVLIEKARAFLKPKENNNA